MISPIAPTWRATGALHRALVVGVVAMVVSVVLGRPEVTVLVAPILVVGVLGAIGRPRTSPVVVARLDQRRLVEGAVGVVVLDVAHDEDVEQVTRVPLPASLVRLDPPVGVVAARGEDTAMEVSPRRWGRQDLVAEQVALTSAWCGFRWGPVRLPGHPVAVRPGTAPYASSAESPQPRGIVGPHRSSRTGSGSEVAGIRGFRPGDRLRRINWRVSARTGTLHVTTARAEEDAATLLLVDVVLDHGYSGGVDGAASSLDLTVRAASALAGHTVRQGDRVGLRLVGGTGRQVRFGAGRAHLQRIEGALADMVPGGSGHDDPEHLALRVRAGTTVVVLSALLSEPIVTAIAVLVRRGLPVLVVDTLPPDARPQMPDDTDPALVDLAWRMRRIERESVVASLRGIGCAVVPWEGPGTLDAVLRRMGRAARLPRRGSR